MQKSKHFVCLVLAVFCFLTACVTVAAASKTYYIEELKMSLDIPEYMSVLTRADNPSMSDGVYLEASGAAPDLDIRVLMTTDEKTREFFNLSLLSSSALEEYENAILENPQYSDCTRGEYGGVLFLDFSTYDSVGETAVYGRQSVTVVNGMSIVIMSASEGDALTSEELSLIREVLESVRFDEVLSNAPKVGFWRIFIIAVVIIAVLAVGFLVFSYFMSKKSKEERKRRRLEQERKKDYDVLSRAEQKLRAEHGKATDSCSSEYFDDSYGVPNSEDFRHSTAKSVIKESRSAVKSTGYFFKNLRRELFGGKKKSGNSAKGKKNNSRKPRDFDVFNDKL